MTRTDDNRGRAVSDDQEKNGLEGQQEPNHGAEGRVESVDGSEVLHKESGDAGVGATPGASPAETDRAPATVAELVSGFVGKVQEQIAATNIQANAKETISRLLGSGRADEASAEGVEESANVINLALERLKRRGMSRSIDLKDVLKRQFDAFVTERMPAEGAEDAETQRVVTVDGEFLAQHGRELIPSLVGGVVQALFGDLASDAMSPGESTATPEGTPAAEQSEEGDAARAIAGDPPGLQVRFDFADMFSAFFRHASVQAAAAKEQQGATPSDGAEKPEDVSN